jgi:hypothetical protein
MIADAEVMLDELAITATRQSRTMAKLAEVRGGAEQALPFDERAARLARRIEQVLTMAAVFMGWPGRGRVTHWLVRHSDIMRRHDVGVKLSDELKPLLDNALEVIDIPPQRWYAGVCEADADGASCMADLWGIPDELTITCAKCGTRYDVRERKVMLMRMVEDRLATASEIAKAVHIIDIRVTDDMVWSYAKRGRIAARMVTPQGDPMYRIGDVLNVVREAAQRRAERTAARKVIKK